MQTAERSGAQLKEGLFQALELARWQEVCRSFCEELGFTVAYGGKGKPHLIIHGTDGSAVSGYAVCVTRRAQPIGIEDVQRLWERMEADGVPNGIFFSVDSFTQEAIQFANGREIELIDPDAFLAVTENLTEDSCERIQQVAERIEVEAPVCLRCNLVMEKVGEGRKSYWQCVNHPNCACTYMW